MSFLYSYYFYINFFFLVNKFGSPTFRAYLTSNPLLHVIFVVNGGRRMKEQRLRISRRGIRSIQQTQTSSTDERTTVFGLQWRSLVLVHLRNQCHRLKSRKQRSSWGWRTINRFHSKVVLQHQSLHQNTLHWIAVREFPIGDGIHTLVVIFDLVNN